jgi:hypothetical protein
MKAGGNPRLPRHLRECAANRDKVSIVLNIARLGLVLSTSKDAQLPATMDECLRSLLLLALAAREPASLCTGGSSLKIPRTVSNWLFSPEGSAITAGFETQISHQTAISTGSDASTAEYVQLDLVFPLAKMHRLSYFPPTQGSLDRAKLFMDWWMSYSRSSTLSRLFDAPPLDLAKAKEIFIQTLACSLECGQSWMSEVSKQWYRENNEFIPLAVEWLHRGFQLSQSSMWNTDNIMDGRFLQTFHLYT